MQFELDDGQKLLASSVRDFAAQKMPGRVIRRLAAEQHEFPRELWTEMAALGWLGCGVPSDYGGSGGTFLDLAVILEEMGYACFPGPFLTSMLLGTLPVLDSGSEEQKKELLPMLTDGRMLATMAFLEPDVDNNLSLVSTKALSDGSGGYEINGTKAFVTAADIADVILTVAVVPGRGLTILIVPARSPGITYCPIDTLGGERIFRLCFDRCKVARAGVLGKEGEAGPILEMALRRAGIGTSAMMVGAMRKALEMTVNYAKLRIQFDRPIGSFQAVQHHCANMALDVDGSRLITYEAAWRLSQGMPAVREASMAKGWVSEAFRRVMALAHQVHGGAGLMADHDLTLYTKRLPSWVAQFGDSDYHWEKTAAAIGL